LAKKLRAKAHLIQGFQIVLDNGRSHCVIVDQPAGTGTDVGPTPLELCVMSHAGCYVVTCALIAKKMRIPLKGLDVKVEAIETEEVETVTEEAFDINLKAEAPVDRIRRLHELTLKSCSVGKIFEQAGVKLSYNVKASRM
jgi:putative redox protein